VFPTHSGLDQWSKRASHAPKGNTKNSTADRTKILTAELNDALIDLNSLLRAQPLGSFSFKGLEGEHRLSVAEDQRKAIQQPPVLLIDEL
jgi:hypothetical protein